MRAAIPDFPTSTLFRQRANLKANRTVKFGRGERIRTSDPHNPIVVRYQAALRPDRIRNRAHEALLHGGNDTCHSLQKKGDFLATQNLKNLFKFQA